MKAFTFLGTGQLHESIYTFEGKESCSTQFFAEAIVEFFELESLYIFVTDSAKNKPVSEEIETPRLAFLKARLDGRIAVVPVKIPEGADEKELWEIFNIVVDHIQDNDRVLFDITHGFRSLPFLTFLALAYVRNVKSGVEIERVIYGAYEAVERSNPRKPVFDLTPFVGLLDWLGAVTMFQRTGDARPIAELLSNTQKQLQKMEIPTTGLSKASGALENLSGALMTNRTLEAQKSAADLSGILATVTKSAVATPVQPFYTLMEQIQAAYEPLGLQNPTNPDDRESLRKQHKQIQWYAKNQQYLQAVTLTREWLISWTCVQLGLDWLRGHDRKKAEDKLNLWVNTELADNPFASLGGTSLPERELYLQLWEQVRDLRNELAHCGMPTQNLRNRSIKSSTKADIRNAQEVLQKLDTLVDKTLT